MLKREKKGCTKNIREKGKHLKSRLVRKVMSSNKKDSKLPEFFFTQEITNEKVIKMEEQSLQKV